MDSTPLCQPHFVFIPLMSPGHLLPMVDMAKLFARRNLKVTIVTTPLNSNQFQASIEREIQSGSPIQIQLVQFPNTEAGIPEGCESVDTLPSMDLLENFYIALCLLKQPLEELFQKLIPTPSCIICDNHITCTVDIANTLQIPRIMFDGTNCFHLLCNHNLLKVYDAIISDDEEEFLVPGMPHRIEFRKSQLPGRFNPGTQKNLNSFREAVRVAAEKSYGLVVNSFEELEEEYVKEYRRVTGKKVWCVGPVSLSNKDELDKAERGKKRNSNDESKYMKWLDSWPSSSVIYVCLGSLNRATPEQLIEVGLGLEATKRPFIWVLRGAYKREEMEKWLLEDGFEERVKGRGLLIHGWAPQVLILSHKAIGAFLTHCGWNSTLEGVCAGVPLVTFPLFAEQFYNEKVVVQLLEIGVSVGSETVVRLGEEEKSCVQVKRENVKDSIENVMGEGNENEKIRERARKYADMARKAIEEGGSSYHNMSLLIEDIINVNRLNQRAKP
ncbi:UDP-glycosyltransferase 73C4-like [Gastrolobium bilobum]|uniref:UDP-glycosyltransferase 73C4-like n=1 Tax=Gastrolobium bilobum TaxID=150636 RepID=UPI002AAFDC7B|nr:UDP-glycosyltransferase 73C4-like [Gastrolobium bilobum]